MREPFWDTLLGSGPENRMPRLAGRVCGEVVCPVCQRIVARVLREPRRGFAVRVRVPANSETKSLGMNAYRYLGTRRDRNSPDEMTVVSCWEGHFLSFTLADCWTIAGSKKKIRLSGSEIHPEHNASA